MRCRLAVLTAVLAVGSLAACSRDKGDRPAPQAQPAVAAASTVPRPGGSVEETKPTAPGPGPSAGGPRHGQGLPSGTQLSEAGVGPYVIGIERVELASAGLVGAVSAGTDGCESGTGLREYGTPALFFTKGALRHLKITDAAIRTPAGVGVGTALAEAKRAYPGGRVLAGPAGATAWFAENGDFALLMRIGDGKVAAIEAGPAATLPLTFTGGQGC